MFFLGLGYHHFSFHPVNYLCSAGNLHITVVTFYVHCPPYLLFGFQKVTYIGTYYRGDVVGPS